MAQDDFGYQLEGNIEIPWDDCSYDVFKPIYTRK